MWPLLGMALLGAVQGDQQRRAQENANKQNANISAAQTEYSPWTHLGASTPQIQAPGKGASALAGLAQGALSGAMYSSANPEKAAAPTPGVPMQSNISAPAIGNLGGSSYANSLYPKEDMIELMKKNGAM